jgi:truncated hemoglobin YjbI
MELSTTTEEVASFYAKMLDHDYTSKAAFNKNFFKDWRRVCTIIKTFLNTVGIYIGYDVWRERENN